MDEKPLLEMLNEYFVYIEDDEGETEPPDWWNNGWYDGVGYSQEWGERLLELAKQTLEQAEAEREIFHRLFSKEGVRGGWPDDDGDEPTDWEIWKLQLYGLEAGDFLFGKEALEHIASLKERIEDA